MELIIVRYCEFINGPDRLRNPTTWSGSFTGTPKFDRGFTGHEHLWHFGLINMNGRMYDPVMCCFLSVDSYVQDPESPQNFNRYAYCLNNPLKYTDPDGEWVHGTRKIRIGSRGIIFYFDTPPSFDRGFADRLDEMLNRSSFSLPRMLFRQRESFVIGGEIGFKSRQRWRDFFSVFK